MSLVYTTTSKKTYDRVGWCIYCGRTEPEIPRLTIEHIIAYSIGGLWELPAASCDDCSDATKGVEGFLARDVAWAFRARHKIQSRRKYPTTFPFHIVGEDGPKIVKVTLPEHHGLLTLPALQPPGILEGRAELPVRPTFSIKPWHYPALSHLNRFADRHGGRGLSTGPINALTMAQLIAKIAHSYCVAEGKLGPAEGLLTSVILGTAPNTLWLVGGSLDDQPVADALHLVYCEDKSTPDGTYLVCYVQLFACLGAPLYIAVVRQKI